MQESEDGFIPPEQRPDEGALTFNLSEAVSGILSIRTEIPEDGFTAHALGTERAGTALLIDASGLVLTIGYLIAEAEQIWLLSANGGAVEGHVLAYDFVTGFGLVQALGRIEGTPLVLGDSSAVRVGDPVVFAGSGGTEGSLQAQIVSRREFAGYWEYLLDEAIFTVPAHPSWGGAAVLNEKGEVIALGSLFVGDARGQGTSSQGNMAVPINLAKDMIDEVRSQGHISVKAKPWMGMYMAEVEDYLVVAGLAPNGPAETAGVEAGDVVMEVAASPIGDLADLLRTVWSLGDPGITVPLTLVRDGVRRHVDIKSASRGDFLRTPRLH